MIEREFVDEAGTPQRLKLGVIGVAPPQIAKWDEVHVRGRLITLDIVEAARAELRHLRSRVDLIVALCHSGISRLASAEGEENAGQDLAKLDGIDALILGHQHLLLPGEDFAGLPGVDAKRGTLHGKPAVMAGSWGSHLGIIDLELEKDAGGWRVAEARVEARPIATRDATGGALALTESDRSVLEAAKAAHHATLHYIRTPIGRLATPLNTYLALIADNATVRLVNEAQRAYAAPLVAARADLASLPILSAASPFRCGGRAGPHFYTDIAPGPLAIKDVADVYPYPNSLRVVRIDGATLREWLERSASIFRRIDPGLQRRTTSPRARLRGLQFRRDRRRRLRHRRHSAGALRRIRARWSRRRRAAFAISCSTARRSSPTSRFLSSRTTIAPAAAAAFPAAAAGTS